MTQPTVPAPWRICYSYSHRDADLRERIATYLAPLRHQRKIVEWHDRKIEPGTDWDSEIASQLDSAHLILFLISADFLASDYCFGVEVERALARLKRHEVRVLPVLLKPCLWKESRFANLQMVPRDAKPLVTWSSQEEAFTNVATEIWNLISVAPPADLPQPFRQTAASQASEPPDLARAQIRSYARLYELTRQRMPPGPERTARMEQIFERMRPLAIAAHGFVDELADSSSPGERLAAVAILQLFASERFLHFLVQLVGQEQPFVGYHAARALHFAVGALDSRFYPTLLASLREAQVLLSQAIVGFDTDRQTLLRQAEADLCATMGALAGTGE